MIVARALGSMPEFISAQVGAHSLDRVMSRSRLPYAVLEQRDVFIPETMLVSFLRNAARETGEDRFGLLVSPHLTVADYGIWGEYVLSAPTLGESLARVTRSIGLHSNDRVGLNREDGGAMSFTYDFVKRGEAGYDHIAACAVGVIWSIFRHYVGPTWRPDAVELDLNNPGRTTDYEDVFACPVHFGRDRVLVRFAGRQLHSARPGTATRMVTAADVERSRLGGAPKTAAGKVLRMVMLQLLDDAPDLEEAAEGLDVGVRTLQRTLAAEGTTFRDIVKAAILSRSRELLTDSPMPITEIGVGLGYSSPSHFARAFRKVTGLSPRAYRALFAH
ncbi:MAG: AraC family transcriptional regulator [Bauldia sp.]|nr:AraC family transcriptional regulator [Bauldia sp.]